MSSTTASSLTPSSQSTDLYYDYYDDEDASDATQSSSSSADSSSGEYDSREGGGVRTKGIFDSHITGVIEMRKGDLDLNFVPSVQPKIKPRLLARMLRRFFQALALWHFLHVIVVIGFLYFSIKYAEDEYASPKVPTACYVNGTITGTLKDLSSFSVGSADYNTCQDYQHWLDLNNTNWREGVIIYTIFNGIAAFASLVYSYFLWRKLNKLQPKDAAAVLKSIFYGFPKGSFMVSYAWKDDPDQFQRPTGELPRKVGSFFPAAWLDIENLIPGTPVKAACRNAATQALFRFTFISTAYLASPNCQAEWEGIRAEPGHSFIFAYPNTDEDVLKELEREGHLVVRLTPELRTKVMTADWWLDHMVRTRRANPLFQLFSPGINERWRPTLRFWHGEGSWAFFIYSFPLMFGGVVIVAIDFLVAYYYKFNEIFTGYEGTAFLFAVALLLPILAIFVGVYVFWYLIGTGYHKKGLPDVAYLLSFLVHIGVIDQVKFYSNSPDVTSSKQFQVFVATKVVKVVSDVNEADIRCLLLDDVAEGQFKKEDVDDRYVFWTRNGFVNLSNYAKDTFGTYIIGDEVPGIEFLGSKILMHVFHVGAEDLVVGSRPFETLFQKKDADNATTVLKKRGLLCCKKMVAVKKDEKKK